MIKLIATDMDGTLLDEHSQLPKGFFSMLNKLKKKDIKFVIASGRSYSNLYETFKPYSDSLHFICDNGSYIVDPGRKPIISIIDKNAVKEMIETLKKIDSCVFVLCGEKCAYHMPCAKEYETEIDKYYTKKKIVKNFDNIDDNIFKIAVCDLGNPATNSFKALNERFGDKFKIVVSGAVWVDVNNLGINKGTALKEIQKTFDISYNETMAFGDFYNDIELLKTAHFSFVMKNANEDMKKHGNFVADSNRNNGVIKAIEKYVFNA